MEKTKKIKSIIKSQGRTITWVAEQLGMSQPSLSQRLAGKVDFKQSEIKHIEKLLNVKF